MKTAPFLTRLAGILALGALASCDSLKNMNPMGSLGGGNSGAQSTIDNQKNIPVSFLFQLPPDAKVGTWWETKGVGGTKTKHAIVAEMDGKLVIESPMDVGGTNVVNAILVDPNVNMMRVPSPGEKMTSNVSKAWIGIEGEKPVERKVMDAPTMPEPTGDAPAVNVDMKEGTETVTLAGKSWNTKWTEVSGAKTWVDSATNFTLKMVSGGNVITELSGWGSDAKPMLDWN